MTLTLQEISDRVEITDTITRYSYGLDQRIWPEWAAPSPRMRSWTSAPSG
ncbi:hypothetical protein [Occultella kanbiaonis]|nr:hypothetical protein [Occultella kanbiaonis]